ncbi:DUF433 domain-containing protein [cf. Phormidesmis sp. LEGE 11477]|uniref:type VII toxin-antitoxin system MntA family adenylyltransferase antitoxin n=1 Tax=cf. Phormidesmis sp. LEGE 11477 TaxID=1828680 RepID=UPI001881BB5A|nr:DUF433 domain-containing protein [cf. Phormidesmis sp. LEGE 11477]MBE9063445.1 DUF433 domain-containing protein [cf. Phormidesmis sp. LEGE 11477]
MTTQQLLERITTRDTVLDGKPSIREHNLSVETVLGQLADGETYESLLARYDWLELEDIQACLLYAKRLVQSSPPEPSWEDLAAAIPSIVEKAPYIQLLVLFGSRARGAASRNSDWDFAFLCDEEQRRQYESGGLSFLRIRGILQSIYHLKDEQIDVIEMKDCSDLLAHYIAKEGKILYEQSPGIFDTFKQKKLKTNEELAKDSQRLQAETRQIIAKLKRA